MLLYLKKTNTSSRGWIVQAIFQIILNSKDKALLEKIQAYFGVGVISEPRKNVCHYKV
jgi:LAGLIDADG endonuclease